MIDTLISGWLDVKYPVSRFKESGVWCFIILSQGTSRLLSRVWCLVSGVWCVLSGVYCLVSGVWRVLSGVWCVLSGVWCLACVVCNLVSVVLESWLKELCVWRPGYLGHESGV